MPVSEKVPSFRYIGPACGLMPALQAAKLELAGRLTPTQVAAHNAFISAMRDEDTHGDIDTPSRFVGITVGLDVNARV